MTCASIRLPRHGASCPVGIGVSCSADRQMLGKITRDGVFIETSGTDPAQYLPPIDASKLAGEVVRIDLNQPMERIPPRCAPTRSGPASHCPVR